MIQLHTPVTPFNKYPSKLTLAPEVVQLFLSLVQPKNNSQLYTNHLDTWKSSVEKVIDHGVKLTAITSQPAIGVELESLYNQYQVSILETPHYEFHQPRDQFHLAFGFYPWLLNQEAWNADDEKNTLIPILRQDKLLLWKCSEGKPNRMAPEHLIGIEGLLHATICSGYFGIVVPKRWIGREMRYMRWWMDHAALVARIKLPPEAVLEDCTLSTRKFDSPFEDNPEKLRRKGTGFIYNAIGNWELLIWQRPGIPDDTTPQSLANASKMSHAEFRYTPYVFPLASFESESIKLCKEGFKRHDWWLNSIKPWHEMIEDHETNPWCGTYRMHPHGVKQGKEVWFFDPKPDFQYQIQVVPTTKEIEADPLSVQLRVGSALRMKTRTIQAMGAMLDLQISKGVSQVEDKATKTEKTVFTFKDEIRRKSFIDIRESLISSLSNHGLVPYMTENDWHKMKKRERWLAIQLTPIERLVQTNVSSEEAQSEDARNWEWVYEDIGIGAQYPELIDMWTKRAKSMNLHLYLAEFQLRDVVIECIKQSMLLGNVMGIGKTRETLFAMILRCVQHGLIICPDKLTGVWQDEIQDTIVPFIRKQRKNWQGRIMDGTTKLIQTAADCLPDNLAQFNLISYDKLKSVPRDGKFYKCPDCGFIAYRAYDDPKNPLRCPGDPNKEPEKRCSHRIKNWREANRRIEGERPGRRKYKIVLDQQGNIIARLGHWLTTTEVRDKLKAKLGDKYSDFLLESCRIEVVDERPPRPSIPVMEPLEHVYKKMIRVKAGVEVNKHTGEERDVYVVRERDYHVKWTFAELIRWTFNFVAADEALYFMNEESARSQALVHVCAQTRIPLTGTPLKGYSEKMLNILNWTFKREVFPDYREYDAQGRTRWLKKYETKVRVGGVISPDGTMIGGKSKSVPKVNNPELFQAELAPLMLRHTRNEPIVTKDFPRKKVIRQFLEVTMDDEHKAYYRKWLKEFAEWWAIKQLEEEGKAGQNGELMTKMVYLANASSIPHYMLEPILEGGDEEGKAWAAKIGRYKGPPVAKMKKAWELIGEGVKAFDKTIVFSARHKNSDLGHYWAQKVGLNSMIVDGRVPLKPKAGEARGQRHNLVEAFKSQDYHVMWAGLAALAEGMNIPEANRGIILDCDWDPSTPRQAIGRMIRPAQMKTVYATYVIHHGAVDGYMAALCELKGRGGDEAIDYMEFNDFSVKMIPDIRQYADAIVDGTEEIEKQQMWSAIEHIRRQQREEQGE
jgi:hypothetical protein